MAAVNARDESAAEKCNAQGAQWGFSLQDRDWGLGTGVLATGKLDSTSVPVSRLLHFA